MAIVSTTGDGGDDVLFGGPGNDRLSGGRGDDTVLGSGGEDTLIGGEDVDTALFARRSTDFAFGRVGDDVIARDLRNGGFTVIDDSVERVIFSNGGIDFNDLLEFVGRKDGQFPSFAPEPESAATVGADALFGGSGAERIAGRGGDDRIEGAGGSDTLLGGSGQDTLLGGGGRDSLEGGGGADQFLFRAGQGFDAVADFGRGADRIGFLSGPDAFDDLTLLQRGDDVVIRFAGGRIRLEDMIVAELEEDDFLF